MRRAVARGQLTRELHPLITVFHVGYTVQPDSLMVLWCHAFQNGIALRAGVPVRRHERRSPYSKRSTHGDLLLRQQ
jgi:hypothetical protein